MFPVREAEKYFLFILYHIKKKSCTRFEYMYNFKDTLTFKDDHNHVTRKYLMCVCNIFKYSKNITLRNFKHYK